MWSGVSWDPLEAICSESFLVVTMLDNSRLTCVDVVVIYGLTEKYVRTFDQR